MSNTIYLGDNRVQQVNLMDVPVGVTVHVTTQQSNWYFCRVEGSTLIDNQRVRGVMIVTDSRTWGQILSGPFQNTVDAEIQIGKAIQVSCGEDNSWTGDARTIAQERS